MARRRQVPPLRRISLGAVGRLCRMMYTMLMLQLTRPRICLSSRSHRHSLHVDGLDDGDHDDEHVVRGRRRSQLPYFVLDETHLQVCIRQTRMYLLEETPTVLAEEIAVMWLKRLQFEVERLNKMTNHRSSCVDMDLVPTLESRPTREFNSAFLTSSDQVYVTLRLTEVIIWPRMRSLDLGHSSKQFRSALYNLIGALPATLQCLKLGAGTGGWLSEAFLNKYYLKGMSHFKYLNTFSMHNDCTNAVLSIISENCGHNLRVLDIQHSQVVSNIEPILSHCSTDALVDVGLCGTSVSVNDRVMLLKSFPLLVRFIFDDVSEVLHEFMLTNPGVKLNLVDFRCTLQSDSLYHEPASLDVISKVLPRIQKLCLSAMQLQESGEAMSKLEYLRELVICGNTDVNQYTQRELASDLLSDVPVNCSAKLCSLELVHLEGLTFQLIDKIAQKCCNLSKLSIQNCSLSLNLEAVDKLQWSSVKTLIVQSRCDSHFLKFLLRLCPNLTDIQLGIACDIHDRTICSALDCGSLRNLRSFYSSHSSSVTMYGVFKLINHCQDLRSIGDLSAFDSVSPADIQSLRSWIREHNILLQTKDF